MGFVKKVWKNRKSEYPNRRLLTKEDGSTELVTVSREEGLVSDEGDPFAEDTMNDLEDRIEEGFKSTLGDLKFTTITQAAYNALAAKDSNTIYLIAG